MRDLEEAVDARQNSNDLVRSTLSLEPGFKLHLLNFLTGAPFHHHHGLLPNPPRTKHLLFPKFSSSPYSLILPAIICHAFQYCLL